MLEDLYTEKFYVYSNKMALRYTTDEYIGNEVFYTITQNKLAIEFFLIENEVNHIELNGAAWNIETLIVDIAKDLEIDVIGSNKFKTVASFIMSNVLSYCIILATYLFLIIKLGKMPYNKGLVGSESKFTLTRTFAAKKKISFMKDINFKYEDISSGSSIYSYFKRKERLSWLNKCLLESFSELNGYTQYAKNMVGTLSSNKTKLFYSKRVVHTLLYKKMLDNYFFVYKGKEFFTGNCIDRFAMIEADIGKKHNVKVSCIPHGMEFGYLFPNGYPCDIHYCTTQHSAEVMNELYDTEKFIYDDKIAENMMKIPSPTNNTRNEKRVVFFTEPREIEVNIRILDELVEGLINDNIDMYIKLHPNDEKSNYDRFKGQIIFMDDFNEAIYENVCIARKSTVLVEALHNRSTALSILINEKDKSTLETFPSLNDENILKFYAVSDLIEFIRNVS